MSVRTVPDETFYAKNLSDQKYLCPDHRAFVVRSKDPMSRLNCDQNCLCPDFTVFQIVHVQSFVRCKPHFVRSKKKNLRVHVQTIVWSKAPIPKVFMGVSKLRMSRISCIRKELYLNLEGELLQL